jgi:hypothetical protein
MKSIRSIEKLGTKNPKGGYNIHVQPANYFNISKY